MSIHNVDDDIFNTLYYLDDRNNYRIFIWVDNNIVTMVSTVHTGYEKISRIRRSPSVNIINRESVKKIWGDQGEKEIQIPGVIDDYNYNMLGVDKLDQFIAYYRPDMRCRCYWMDLFFHCLDIIRINTYIIFNNSGMVSNMSHKRYLEDWIGELLGRATSIQYGWTRGSHDLSLDK